MRVSTASLHLVRLPLVRAFQTSSHSKNHLDHIIVSLRDGAGTVGWGEIASPSDPFYCSETVQSCWHVAETYLLPALLDAEWDHPGEVPALWSKVRGNQFAKAGVDMAVWSLWSAAQGMPLATALGGTRTEVIAGVSLGIEPTIDDLLIEVRRRIDDGYPRVKLKIAPGWDVEPVRAVRSAYGDLDLHVDANGIYSESDEHLSALRALDEFGLTMIEQPFHPRNLPAHARLQRRISTPICLDESVETLEDLDTALALEALRVLNIKVSRLGGLTAARAAHDRAQALGIPVWCGGMHEFGIGRLANVAISSLPGFALPGDLSSSSKYYSRDIVVPPVVAADGVVPVPSTPGLGHEIDTEFLAANTLRSVSQGRPAAPW